MAAPIHAVVLLQARLGFYSSGHRHRGVGGGNKPSAHIQGNAVQQACALKKGWG